MATWARLSLVLVLLITVTVFSWWLGGSHGGAGLQPDFAISVAVLSIALVKVRLIMREFMEMGLAPAWVRRSGDAWLLLMFTALFVVRYSY